MTQDPSLPNPCIDASATAQRKTDHLHIALHKDVDSRLSAGFDGMSFVHEALPEIAYEAVDTTTSFLGKNLKAPFLISAMTGGTPRAEVLNRRLAAAAQKMGVAMGLGSMRILLEDPSLLPSFNVRAVAPDIVLLANLGAVQLNKGVDVGACQRLVDMVQADALVLHLNPLQEVLQPEGDTDWSHLVSRIETLVRHLPIPVIVKEVGYGLSPRVIRLLREAGVHALDVAGAGGTSWSQVESHRAHTSMQARLAESFQGWGIPTLRSLSWAVTHGTPLPVIASGGIRSGIEAAKALHLGAHLCGSAHPFLKAAQLEEEAVVEELQLFIAQLKVTMLCTASRTLAELRNAAVFWTSPL